MSTGPEIRPRQPQTFPMQSFSFAPPNMGVGTDKKNYVFVDEHNRHKRLKVMRACEGCRKRKIKCDAATTNQWPCASCKRLKHHCIPPALNYDRAHTGTGHVSGLERVLDFDNSDGSDDDDYSHPAGAPQVSELQDSHEQMHGAYGAVLGPFNTPPYSDKAFSQHEYAYDDISSMPLNIPAPSYRDHNSYNPSQSNSLPLPNDPNWLKEQYSTAELSDVLGELKINENGVAPYISQQKRSLAETPAYEEFEVKLPTASTSSGATVRIPPDLMPSEEQCMEWFEIFFTHIHPYVPVISKPYFYQQWRSSRRSISPLILEAIFACAARMSNDPAQGAQWLALASNHEDCFMDVPRLSTIQALLLLLKARESAHKRGYYFRSWMAMKKLVTMAHDLELHEHYAVHQAGRDCGSDPTECLIKTRIWQNIFICEMMIGGPQGRTDMGIDPDTVDLNIQRPLPGIDSSDYQISRQFTYFARKVRCVRSMHDIKTSASKTQQKDFAADARFISLGTILAKWLQDLPRDIQVIFPDDETPPWLPSHFVGNMHSYYHLSVIMLHRPQLELLSSPNSHNDPRWRREMSICQAAAKAMCRLQEGILQTFGIPGLVCMQRGINFVMYAVLTCVNIHLVCITNPLEEYNSDAKDYLTRSMRILEICIAAWPVPEMQPRIDAFKEAFSADSNRPFELKRSFPYGSPSSSGTFQPSPPPEGHMNHPIQSHHDSHGQQTTQLSYHAQPITPPISAGFDTSKENPMSPASMPMMQQQHLPLQTSSMDVGWNPAPIFSSWNTAFGLPATVMASATTPMPQQSSPPLFPPSSLSSAMSSLQTHQLYPEQSFSMPSDIPSLSRVQTAPQQPAYASPAPSFVTPSMWRDTVASTYDPGALKRRHWDTDSDFVNNPGQVKRPR
ncbi:hypothetical protein ABVK25_007095 [Lepraria finkii]|uniref:Zn(2)-C6 fungal-type domain-containing protein n=1 Tax=Lepraria finkii TaxID=1340010 RepID=A0ABR4B3S3_9LECA